MEDQGQEKGEKGTVSAGSEDEGDFEYRFPDIHYNVGFNYDYSTYLSAAEARPVKVCIELFARLSRNTLQAVCQVNISIGIQTKRYTKQFEFE